jgi:hypothetical protein
MNKLADRLPPWSKTIGPRYQPNYTGLTSIALEFITLPPEKRRAEVQAYSNQYCFPRFDLEKASGLYLLLRLVFDLPSQYPRQLVQVFGGWLHPSIGTESPYFDLSWPVKVEANTNVMTIERSQGYSGKGYDAIGEYDYFVAHFPLRRQETLQKLKIGT